MKLSAVLALIAVELGNPNIANLQAMVFEGRASLDDLKARSWSAGAGCLVAWTGVRESKAPGTDATDITVQFAASLSVPGRAAPASERKNVIADLTQAVIARLYAVEWPDDVRKPALVRAQNLYVLEDSKNNLSRAVVLWEQTVRSKFNEDAPDLPPLARLHHEINTEGTNPAPIITKTELEQP